MLFSIELSCGETAGRIPLTVKPRRLLPGCHGGKAGNAQRKEKARKSAPAAREVAAGPGGSRAERGAAWHLQTRPGNAANGEGADGVKLFSFAERSGGCKTAGRASKVQRPKQDRQAMARAGRRHGEGAAPLVPTFPAAGTVTDHSTRARQQPDDIECSGQGGSAPVPGQRTRAASIQRHHVTSCGGTRLLGGAATAVSAAARPRWRRSVGGGRRRGRRAPAPAGVPGPRSHPQEQTGTNLTDKWHGRREQAWLVAPRGGRCGARGRWFFLLGR